MVHRNFRKSLIVVLVGSIIFACLAGFKGISTAEEATALNLLISLDKTTYIQGEEITLSVAMTNFSQQGVVVQMPSVLAYASVIRVIVVDKETGNVLQPHIRWSSAGRSGKEVILPSGASIGISYDLIDGLYPFSLKPGAYAVYATYEAGNIRVSSEKISFDVLEPPSTEKIPFQLYIAARKAGPTQEGITQCVNLLKKHPESIFAHRMKILLGDYYQSVGKPADSVKVLQEVLSHDLTPNQTYRARFQLALALKEAGRLEEAISQMKIIGTDYTLALAGEWSKGK